MRDTPVEADEYGPEDWYSHHWVIVEGIDPTKLPLIAEDVADIIRRSEIPIVGVHGIPGTQASITPDEVGFNGLNRACCCDIDNFDPEEHQWVCISNYVDDSHDPFILNFSKLGVEFCITERKPYDAVVGAVLLTIKYHLPRHFFIASDGKFGSEWKKGAGDSGISPVAIYEHLFPERGPITRRYLYCNDEVFEHGMDLLMSGEQRQHVIARFKIEDDSQDPTKQGD